jgi:hypothetical protein
LGGRRLLNAAPNVDQKKGSFWVVYDEKVIIIRLNPAIELIFQPWGCILYTCYGGKRLFKAQRIFEHAQDFEGDSGLFVLVR